MKRLLSLLALTLVTGATLAQGIKVKIDPDKVLNPITPLLYGAGMEDVNHEI